MVGPLVADLERAEQRARQAVEDFNKARERELQARLITERIEPLKLEPVDTGLDVPMLTKTVGNAIARLNANRVKGRP